MTRRTNIILLLTLPLLLAVYFLVRSSGSSLSDWAGYYFGSTEVLKGNYELAYDPASLNLLIFDEGYHGEFVSYTPFPPFTALMIAPFLVFSASISKIIFTSFSLICFFLSLYRCVKFFSIPNWFLFLVPVIFFFPFRSNIFLGQGYFLLTALLIEGFLAHWQKKPLLSAFFWAFAALFKIFPVLIVLFLLFRRRYREAIYFLISCVVLFSLSLLVVGFGAWKFYILDIFPRLNNGEFNDPFSPVFQSAFMFFKDLFVYDPLLNRSGAGAPYIFLVCNILFKSLVMGLCMYASIKRNIHELLVFGLWITASLLISPNGSNYSLILLVIPFLGVGSAFQELLQHKAKMIAIVMVLFLAANIPVHYFQSLPFLLKFPRLYLLIILFLLLLSLNHVEIRAKIFVAVFIGFGLVSLASLPGRLDKSEYLLGREEHILIYNYSVRDQKLVYYYWDDKGGHEVVTDFSVRNINYEAVTIIDGQLYFQNRRVTDSKDHKKKPALVNGRMIVYLSDLGRGVGFYSLRQVDPF